MQTRTSIDIGVTAAEGIRTTVAGGFVRSQQIRQASSTGRIELAGQLFVSRS